MLRYTPGQTLAHRLDPRSKLAFQFGFAIAAVTVIRPEWTLFMFGLGVISLWAAGLSVRVALREYWIVLATLAIVPVIAGITLSFPFFDLDSALGSAQAISRVVPVLLVSAAFVYSTPVRDTRAAIQQTVPGKVGQLLGVAVSLTVRFIPLVRRDVLQVREAIRARGGDVRSVADRAGRITVLSAARALSRSERLSLALQARCFAWNPTLPRLRLRFADYVVLLCALALTLSPLALRLLS